jgi:hypothetical protein
MIFFYNFLTWHQISKDVKSPTLEREWFEFHIYSYEIVGKLSDLWKIDVHTH